MNYFDPADAESARQNAMLNPIQPGDMGPGFWTGSGTATLKGLAQGVIAQPALLLGDAATAVAMPGAKKIDELFGGSNAQDWLKGEQQKTVAAVHALMPGPQTGLLGNLGYGFGSMVPQAAAGFVTGGPAGAAAAVGSLQGYAAKRVGETYEGLDESTAIMKGIIEGGFAAAGVALPPAFGTGIGTMIATGIGGNVGLGIAQRGATSALLEANGYDKLAEQYKAFDLSSIAVDAVLGAAFGGVHARFGQTGEGGKIPPTLTDAVLAENKQNHLQVSVAPGVPDGPQSRSLHGRTIDKAMRDIMGDEPVDVSGTGIENAAFVPNRAVQEARVEAAVAQEGTLRSALDAVDELRQRAEAMGIKPADEALFEGKKLVDEVRDAVEASGARDLPGAVHGRDGEVFVGDRREPVRFVLVEAETLAATIAKSDNQFRDRSRAASQQQVAKIAGDLQFGRLGEAPTMAEGAPTVAQDGTVVGGNGRVAAVQQAYARGLGEGYRVALEQRAAEFGLSADQVQGFTRPMLVRQFTNPVDVRTAAILSNESAGLRMSALEQAKVDSERMPVMPEMPESGDLGAASLRGFVNQWLAKYPQGELGEFVDAAGKLSPQGEKRLQNAILFRAYGDTPTLARLIESTDDLSRNLAGALTKSAANVAEARDLIAAGELHDLDIQPQLLQAVDTLQRLRTEGTKLDDFLAQEDMFGSGVGPESVLLMQHFQANARSQKGMVAALSGYYDAVRALGDPRQESMFAAPPPGRGELLRAVIEGRAVADPVSMRQGERAADPAMQQLTGANRTVLLDIFAAAEKEKPGFDKAIATIAAELGGGTKLAPIKGVGRAVEKIAVDYAGDASRIKDTLRATITVESAENAQAAVGAIFEKFDVLPGGRRNLLEASTYTPDGYRDAKFNVKVGDIVAEVQVNLPAMMEAKSRAHGLYEQRASIERAHEGGVMPLEVQAKIDQLNAAMRAIYEPAWAEATSALKSASDTGEPLRRAESDGKGRGSAPSQASEKATPSTSGFSETGTPSTSKSSARGPKSGSSMSASEASVADIAETATTGVGVRQVLDDMPNAQVVGVDGEVMPAGLAIQEVDAKISTSKTDSEAFPAAAACALR